MRNNTLKETFLIAAVLCILGGIISFAMMSHLNFEKAMVDRTLEQLSLIAKSEAQSIREYIMNVEQELEILSANPAIRNTLSAQVPQNKDPGYALALEDSYKDIGRLADSIYLINDQGKVVSAIPYKKETINQDLSQRADIKALLADPKPYTSGIFELPSGIKAFSSLYPVFEKGKFLGMVTAVIFLERINNLINHINQSEKSYILVIDNKSNIISYPYSNYIGRNIAFDNFVYSTKRGEIFGKMVNKESGSGVYDLFLARDPGKPVKTLVAYVPIVLHNGYWSIAVGEEYSAIAGPVNRNAAESIMLVIFMFLVFIVSGFILYRSNKEKVKAEISSRAVEIINKQLHLEIDERKRVERLLEESLKNYQK
jgi:uncharacterized membrane protein